MYGYFRCHSHIVTVLTCESHYFTDSSCMEVAWSWILFLMYSCYLFDSNPSHYFANINTCHLVTTPVVLVDIEV